MLNCVQPLTLKNHKTKEHMTYYKKSYALKKFNYTLEILASSHSLRPIQDHGPKDSLAEGSLR